MRRGATNAVSRDGRKSRRDLVVRTVVVKYVGFEVAKSCFWMTVHVCLELVWCCQIRILKLVSIKSWRKGQLLEIFHHNGVTVISVIKIRCNGIVSSK